MLTSTTPSSNTIGHISRENPRNYEGIITTVFSTPNSIPTSTSGNIFRKNKDDYLKDNSLFEGVELTSYTYTPIPFFNMTSFSQDVLKGTNVIKGKDQQKSLSKFQEVITQIIEM